MNYRYCLSLLILWLIFTFPIKVFPQLLYSVSLDKKNPSETRVFVDDDGYCAVILKYPSGSFSIMYFQNDGKISEFKETLSYFSFEGFSSNHDVFNIYGSSSSARKVITFDKKTLQVEIKDIVFPNVTSRDDDYLHFSYNNNFYKGLLNKKANTLKIYKLITDQPEMIGNHFLQRDLFKILTNHSFAFIDQLQNVNLSKVSGSKFYWRNDSLIFSYRTSNALKGVLGRNYFILNLKGNSAAERVIAEEVKASALNEFLADNNIFLIKSYYDSLVIDVNDYQTNRMLKKLKFDADNGFNISRSLFVSTEGDTLETRWKENVDKKIIRDFYESSLFISTERVSSGLQLTCGIQTLNSSGGGYAPGVGGAPGTFYPTTSAPGSQKYFKTCLSDELEPIECDSYLSSQDKANIRQNQLVKEDVFRFKEFLTAFDRRNVYLLYVDKKEGNLIIEKF